MKAQADNRLFKSRIWEKGGYNWGAGLKNREKSSHKSHKTMWKKVDFLLILK